MGIHTTRPMFKIISSLWLTFAGISEGSRSDRCGRGTDRREETRENGRNNRWFVLSDMS